MIEQTLVIFDKNMEEVGISEYAFDRYTDTSHFMGLPTKPSYQASFKRLGIGRL